MAATADMTLSLKPESFFHIYNRGNDGIPIFYQEKNYRHFLKKYAEYMKDYWDTFAYCLLSNHFHLLVRIKSQADILLAGIRDFKSVDKTFFQKTLRSIDLKKQMAEAKGTGLRKPADLRNFQNLVNLPQNTRTQLPTGLPSELLHQKLACWAVSERFRRFFLGYAKAINVQENRRGSLFQKVFRRKPVEGEENGKAVITYIHRNPVHHGYCRQMEDYPWSSYLSFLSNRPSLLKRKEVLEWFGGRVAFIEWHKKKVLDWKVLQRLIIED